MLAWLEEWLMPLVADYGLVAVFVTMTLESACIPIPSEVVVPYGGFLAAQGYFSLWAVVLVATVANLVGSSIAYAAGRYGGRDLVLRYGRYVFISRHHLEKADHWFERRGEITVFATRMMPGVRTFISVPAGISRMPFLRFAVYTFLGALPWNLALAYLGWLFGENWELLQEQFSRFNLVVWAALGVALIVVVAAWRLRVARGARAAKVPAADSLSDQADER
jgi:membrane protein DedA with SNARE-associated domain